MSNKITKEEIERKKKGEDIKRIYLGNGKIWEQKTMQPISQEDEDNLPFQ